MSAEELVWSTDGSEFTFQSLGDLLDCRDDLKVGSVVYYGKPERPAETSFLPDADHVIEWISERAYDEHREHAKDWPEVSKEAKAELDALLLAWAKKHVPAPTFYTVTDVREYAVTAEDLRE